MDYKFLIKIIVKLNCMKLVGDHQIINFRIDLLLEKIQYKNKKVKILNLVKF